MQKEQILRIKEKKNKITISCDEAVGCSAELVDEPLSLLNSESWDLVGDTSPDLGDEQFKLCIFAKTEKKKKSKEFSFLNLETSIQRTDVGENIKETSFFVQTSQIHQWVLMFLVPIYFFFFCLFWICFLRLGEKMKEMRREKKISVGKKKRAEPVVTAFTRVKLTTGSHIIG